MIYLFYLFYTVLQLQVCVVFGISFYGPRNITADVRVRDAVRRALYVSSGIDYGNSEVAGPDDTELCGVSSVNTGGFRRALTEEEALAGPALVSIEEYELAQEKARRMEVFGVSDYAVMLRQVEDWLGKDVANTASVVLPHGSLPASILALKTPTPRPVTAPPSGTPAPTVPDTVIYFSVVSNVPRKQSLHFFFLLNLAPT